MKPGKTPLIFKDTDLFYSQWWIIMFKNGLWSKQLAFIWLFVGDEV